MENLEFQDFKDSLSMNVFFFCAPTKSADNAAYQHSLVCLAEGLKELGVNVYSNQSYWKESPDKDSYLIPKNPNISLSECSVVVIDSAWLSSGRPLPKQLFSKDRTYRTVYFELHIMTQCFDKRFREFDFIFRGYYNRKMYYPKNVYPWGFGISNRILKESEVIPSFEDRDPSILINFRHSAYQHSVRKIAESSVLDKITDHFSIDDSTDSLMKGDVNAYHHLQWLQTGKRHYHSYYQRLLNSTGCACFGGFFVPSIPRNQRSFVSRVAKKLICRFDLKTNTILQWDSWRFWEALATGCVAFHIDFEKYGCSLPVMPENWKHYIGVDFDNVQETFDRLNDEPEILEKISKAGREWVVQHYAPVPTAMRFLEIVFPNHQDAWNFYEKEYGNTLASAERSDK